MRGNCSRCDLGHGFHATKQGERYTLSEPARRTVLDRLLTLNHQRCAEEVKAGLHDKKWPKVKGQRPKASGVMAQGELIRPPKTDFFGSKLRVEQVFGIEPDDKESRADEKPMHAPVGVAGKLELPAFTVRKLSTQAKSIPLAGLSPVVGVTAQDFLMRRAHLHGCQRTDIFETVEQFQEIAAVTVGKPEFGLGGGKVFEGQTHFAFGQEYGRGLRWRQAGSRPDFPELGHEAVR